MGLAAVAFGLVGQGTAALVFVAAVAVRFALGLVSGVDREGAGV
jgi:hypothetical protein